MHYGRITTAVGSVLALIGLLLTSASSAGADLLPTLSAIPDSPFPDGFDRVFTALWDESAAGAGIFVIALVAVFGLSMIPNIKDAMSRMNALIVTVLGVVMLAIGAIATFGAQDDADTLEAGFAQAAAGGLIPEAFTVSISFGWYLLVAGGVLAAIHLHRMLDPKDGVAFDNAREVDDRWVLSEVEELGDVLLVLVVVPRESPASLFTVNFDSLHPACRTTTDECGPV